MQGTTSIRYLGDGMTGATIRSIHITDMLGEGGPPNGDSLVTQELGSFSPYSNCLLQARM